MFEDWFRGFGISGRWHRIRSVALVVVVHLTLGCGTSDYDALVQQRVQLLRNPPAPTTADWRSFTTPMFGVTFDAPVDPSEDSDKDEGYESFTMTLANVIYSVQVASDSSGQTLDAAATAITDEYSQLGYTTTGIQPQNVNGVDCRRLTFSSQEGNKAQVQVAQFSNPTRTCSMAVSGESLDSKDFERFFHSIAFP